MLSISSTISSISVTTSLLDSRAVPGGAALALFQGREADGQRRERLVALYHMWPHLRADTPKHEARVAGGPLVLVLASVAVVVHAAAVTKTVSTTP